MRRLIPTLIAVSCLTNSGLTLAQKSFGESLCNFPEYTCIKIKPHENWEMLFHDPQQQDLIKRLNRINTKLKPGMIIAVPNNLENLTIYDISPFPRYIEPTGEKTVYVNQSQLAWGAYDAQGKLVWWGPTSSGSGKCYKPEENCTTPQGSFRAVRKQDIECISTVFPTNPDGTVGGALMPYCMHFFRGYALHGSYVVPGYNDSHGCVRMFIEDAKWLNEEFIDVPGTGLQGTRIIIAK
jgi:lipoprotein-anchoring transpeptidase ErfK/SrfK